MCKGGGNDQARSYRNGIADGLFCKGGEIFNYHLCICSDKSPINQIGMYR